MKRIYETEIEKRREKVAPLFRCIFVRVENGKNLLYIAKMTQLKCLCTCCTITLLSAALLCPAVALYFTPASRQKGKKEKKKKKNRNIFISSKIVDLKCLHK